MQALIECLQSPMTGGRHIHRCTASFELHGKLLSSAAGAHVAMHKLTPCLSELSKHINTKMRGSRATLIAVLAVFFVTVAFVTVTCDDPPGALQELKGTQLFSTPFTVSTTKFDMYAAEVLGIDLRGIPLSSWRHRHL